MKLTLLGTTGYHPNDRRQTACMLLPDLGVAFDAGTALYRVSSYLQTNELDIFLSHAHLDHCFGLTFMFDLRAQCPDLGRVTVHGEPDKLSAIRQHLFSELLFPVAPPFETQRLEHRVELSDGSTLTHFPLHHPGGSVGFRIDWPDRSMAYVTDTTAAASAAYVKHIAGVDLLVHECYFGDDMPEQAELTGHSCLTPVLEVAAKAQVGRLVLVHINPLLEKNDDALNIDKARRIFPDVEIGYDLMEIDF
ncbi:MAG: MBL fold metallo-hydrolase [Planctomycetales bacterium]|nr:MBL fold metallo-hydrolase [Planctomycetales bacterium]